MSKVYDSIEELTGNTPLVRMKRIMQKFDLECNILAKCEFYNPFFSIKDRVAKNMLDKAPFSQIDENTVFIEATSGNTGIALAGFCACRGYKLVIVMPENMSREKIALIRHFGAEVMLTPAEEGMAGAIKKVEILKQRANNLIEFQQFRNPANVEAHQLTTSVEILEDTDGKTDAIVCGVGTAGTISGIASTLKSCIPDLYVRAVEPEESAVLSGGKKGSHQIGGIGAGFIPPLYRQELVNDVFKVSSHKALEMCQIVAQTEGLPIGISAAAAVCGAIDLAGKPEMKEKNIVVILPDSIERYLSNPFFTTKEFTDK